MSLLTSSLKTPIGTLNIICDEHVLLGANFSSLQALSESLDSSYSDRTSKHVSRISIVSDLLENYFDGDLKSISAIKVNQSGGTFSQNAWKAMRKVGAGKVLSYADLAARAGSASAVRAAGSACAKNAIVLVVPCHRIVKTGGSLGNYAYGVEKKEWLLRHEGVL